MPDDNKTPSFTFEPETKRAPGRPKGSPNKTRTAPTATSAADIRQALATMDTLYHAIGMGLLMSGLHKSLDLWSAQTVKLQEQNESALKSAPKLAKFISNAGQTGGAATFLAAHAMAGFTLVSYIRAERGERQVVAEAEAARQNGL